MGGPAIRILTLLIILGATGLVFRHEFGKTSLTRADIVVANGPDPRSLDPAVTTAVADGRLLSSLFEGLLEPDPRTLEPIPAIAAGPPHVSRDGLTWTFSIRENLQWSDGESLEAAGLRWSFLRFLDPKTAARFTELLYPVVGAREYNRTGTGRENVGIHATAHTLTFELQRPVPHFPSILTLFPLYPVPRHAVERWGPRWVKPEHFVCNGPFKPAFWRLRDRIRVVRNPRFREASTVSVKTIDYLCTESATTQLNLYVNDDADIITEVPTSAVPTLLRRYGPRATGEFVPTSRLGTFWYRINLAHPPFTNQNVRLALSHAVNRVAIVQNVTRAGELPASSFVPPSTRCADVVYRPPRGIHHDLDQAKKLLARGLRELGMSIEDLPLFEVLYSSGIVDQAIADVLQQQWSALGFRCRLVHMDGGSIRNAVARRDYTVARASWIGDFNDPSNFLELFTGRDGYHTGFADPDYDELVLRRAPLARSGAERDAIYREAEERLLSSGVVIPIYHYASRSMVKPWIGGVFRNVLAWHPPRWWRVDR